ncbi:MAG: DUF3566 domain-containing protein [Propionibacteriales bacterium]|nr:DUF3566 domain-containing protein [Propionibacteriales bacterium]
MSNPSDDRPIAPPRPLSKPPDQAAPRAVVAQPGSRSDQSQPEPALSSQSGASGSPYSASAGDAQTERTLPVPSTPTANTEASTPQTVDKKAAKQAERTAKRAQANLPRTVRRAKLRVVRVDPWSVTKAAFLLSIAFGIMCVVAIFLIVSIMSASGLWDNVNSTIQGLLKQKPRDQFDIEKYVGMSRIMGITMLIAAIDVIIITALATLGAFIYNMAASLLGGVEVTLAEDLK